MALTRAQGELQINQGRRTYPEDLHITLVFLGDLDAARRACCEEAGDRVRAIRFALRLDRFGCFPQARVLWCGPAQSPRPLLDLGRALEDCLSECGFPPERRPFRPHMTLARKARPMPARDIEHPVSWPVSEFVLANARPGEHPRYRVERSWPLIP